MQESYLHRNDKIIYSESRVSQYHYNNENETELPLMVGDQCHQDPMFVSIHHQASYTHTDVSHTDHL